MPNLNQYSKASLAMASKNVVGMNAKKVWFAYKADPKAEQDSGWVFHGPNENDEFSNSPENFLIVPVDSMIVLNPQLDEIINKPKWTCWERYADNGPWIEVKDFFK